MGGRARLAAQLSPGVVAIPGARRPETARSAARAASLELKDGDRAVLDRAFGEPRPARRTPGRPSDDAEVVLVMGIPGAGKSLVADEYVAHGYVRLNRDERGGTLRDLAGALEEELSSGAGRFVLDNTYLTRRAGLRPRCRQPTWSPDTVHLARHAARPAQVNLVERLLGRFGSLPSPEELRTVARREPGVHAPTSQMRTLRELEPPAVDEGFSSVEQQPFTRSAGPGRAGVFAAAASFEQSDWKGALEQGDRGAPHLVFDWSPDGAVEELSHAASLLAAEVSGPVESAVPASPGRRPAGAARLPGLPLFARKHGSPSRSVYFWERRPHRTLATTLCARYVQV